MLLPSRIRFTFTIALFISAALLILSLSYQQEPSESSQTVGSQCVPGNYNQTFCFEPGKFPYMGKELTYLVGIGPYKTSTTAVLVYLGRSEYITVGSSALEHKDGEAELDYFTHRFEQNGQPSLKDLSSRFFKKDKPKALYAAEKSPDYATDLLAPHRVKAMLGDNLVLVYTVRNPLDSMLSHIFYARWHQIEEERKFTKLAGSPDKYFVEIASAFLSVYRETMDCETALAREMSSSSSANMPLFAAKQSPGEGYTAVHAPAWLGVKEYDELVYSRCYQKYFHDMDKPFPQSEPNQGQMMRNLYSRSMTLWSRVFPGVKMMCIFHQEMVTKPSKPMRRLGKLLGLRDSSIFRNIDNFEVKLNHGNLTQPMERLQGLLNETTDAETKNTIWSQVAEFKKIFEHEHEFAIEFCKKHSTV